jgi:DivIVA domain-containing protein
MALTAEDIVNKQFKPKPRLSEGYDADDVDDFLDDIVKEFRAVRAENDDLKQKLVGAQGRIAELQRAADAGVAPAPTASAASADQNDSATSSQLLQLARKLHDQHVQEGLDERERIIEEGKAQAQRILAEAELRQRNEINELDQQRIGIERKIDELKQFEKEYRSHLKQYLETQLNDLNTSGQESAKNF